MPSYIYLIHVGEYVKRKENVYKVGRTTQLHNFPLRRLSEYSADSVTKFVCQVYDAHVNTIETHIINEFNKHFVLAKGREWFKGDCTQMQCIIFEVATKHPQYIATSQPRLQQSNTETLQVSPVPSESQQIQTEPSTGASSPVTCESTNNPCHMFTCSFCDYVCNRKANLERHLRSLHGEIPMPPVVYIPPVHVFPGERKCLTCYKVFSNKYNLNKHDCQHINSPLECQHCNKVFASSSSKAQHIKKCAIKEAELPCIQPIEKCSQDNKFDKLCNILLNRLDEYEAKVHSIIEKRHSTE